MALNWLLSLKRSSRTIMWGFQTKQSGWPSSQQDRNCPKAADSPISIVSPSFKLTALNCYHIVCFSRFTICPNDQAQTAWIHFLRGEYFCCRWITVCSLEHPPDFMNIWSKSIWKCFPCMQEPLWGIEWGPALPQMISMIRQCADSPGSQIQEVWIKKYGASKPMRTHRYGWSTNTNTHRQTRNTQIQIQILCACLYFYFQLYFLPLLPPLPAAGRWSRRPTFSQNVAKM